MKLIFEKGSRRIVIDDKGKGINGILTTNVKQTDYPFISLTKGNVTKYFRTKWEKEANIEIIRVKDDARGGRRAKFDKTANVPSEIRTKFVRGNLMVYGDIWNYSSDTCELSLYLDGKLYKSIKNNSTAFENGFEVPLTAGKIPSSVRLVGWMDPGIKGNPIGIEGVVKFKGFLEA